MTIHVPEDLARSIEAAVRTGRYENEVDVLRDALSRLPQATGMADSTVDPGEPAFREKPLTKQTLLRHLSDIGLVDHPPATGPGEDDAESTSIGEDEIISEVVIRERLIEWLTGFL